MISTDAPSDTNEQIRHAVTAWSYLVRWGSRLTFAEFAATIRRHSSHERAASLATVLESVDGSVSRDWQGVRANWLTVQRKT
jgi:hypothetical protein